MIAASSAGAADEPATEAATERCSQPSMELPLTLDRSVRFEQLYLAEHVSLVRVAALLTGSTAVAEDLVQEAFAKLYPRLERIDHPPAWLRTVVVNSARNERRGSGVRRRFLARSGSANAAIDADPAVDGIIESLRLLPMRQRAVIVLRFYEDRPLAEIATLLGVRLGTVKSSLHRALATLRMEIEP